jgi:hypothetical protein
MLVETNALAIVADQPGPVCFICICKRDCQNRCLGQYNSQTLSGKARLTPKRLSETACLQPARGPLY